MKELGSLQKVPLRSIWIHEAHAFTRWLAEEKNLEVLSDELDLDITLVQTEAGVGKFNVDILAKETTSDKKIIIENQLEQTNHDHLGKIITYAAGVDAEYIIWVVDSVRDEHKRAIDWLNEHTDEDLHFFLVKVELWQIGDSSPAPKFNVVSQPNDWAKTVKQSTTSSVNLTETKLRQLDFWQKFREFAQEGKTQLRLRKPMPQHWYDISSGASNWHIALALNSLTKKMSCEVYIPENKELFKTFELQKEKIERHLGSDIEWMELPRKKASRIKQSAPFDLSKETEWPDYFAWLLYRAESFRKSFGEL
ncbi:MAG: DUF4268 domain-containing protein [Candidatus Saccharimonadales bacterium]